MKASQTLAFALALLVTATLPLPASAGPLDAPAPVSNNAHTVSDGIITLNEAQLTADTASALNPSTTHTISVILEKKDVGTVTATLYWEKDNGVPSASSNSKTMTYAGDANGGQVYSTTLSPAEYASSIGALEHQVNFIIVTEYSLNPVQYRDPASGDYSYVVDGLSPRISDLQLNDQGVVALAPESPLSLQVDLRDQSTIASASAFITDSGDHIVKGPVALTRGNDAWGHTFPNGLDLPESVYNVRIEAKDSVNPKTQRTFLDVIVIGSANPEAVANSHTVKDNSRTITAASLAADSLQGLKHTDDHTFRVRVDDSLPQESLTVTMYYAVDGSTPTTSGDSIEASFVQTLNGAHTYETVLTHAQRIHNDMESKFQFFYVISSPHFQDVTDGPDHGAYAYFIDGSAPRITGIQFNSESVFRGARDDEVSIKILHEDASAIESASIRIQNTDGSTLNTLHLTPGTEFSSTTLTSGLQLPRGVYDVRTTVTDSVGHQQQELFNQAIFIGDAPPVPAPAEASHVVIVGEDDLKDASLLAGDGALRGELAHTFRLSLEAGHPDEIVTATVHYSIDGHATLTSPNKTLNLVSQGSYWVYEGTVSASEIHPTSAESVVSLLYVTKSNMFPSREESGYSFLSDALAPRLDGFSINGGSTAKITSNTPVTVTIESEDASGVNNVKFVVKDDQGAVVIDQVMETTTENHRYADNNGLGLDTGEYDVEFIATDGVGHESAAYIIQDAIVIDNTPPAVQEFTINGAVVAEVTSQDSVQFRVVVQDPDVATVKIALLDDTGFEVNRYTLQPASNAWSYIAQDGLLLDDGTYDAHIIIQDEAGNIDTVELGYTPLTVDNIAPVLIEGGITYAQATKNAGREGDQVKVTMRVVEANTVGQVLFKTATGTVSMSNVAGTDAWVTTFSAGAQNGQYPFTVTATDKTGNMDTFNGYAIIDNTAPLLSGSQVDYANDQRTAAPGQSVQIIITATDQHSDVVEVLVDASAINAQVGWMNLARISDGEIWRGDVSVTGDEGTHHLPVILHDAAGNQGYGTVEVIVRAAGPHIESLTLDDEDNLDLNATKVITFDLNILVPDGTANAAVIIKNTAGDVVFTEDLTRINDEHYATSVNPGLENGVYTASASVIDNQGRQSTWKPADPNLIIDNANPVIESFTIETGVTGGQKITGYFGDPVEMTAIITDNNHLTAVVKVNLPSGGVEEVTMNKISSGEFYAAPVFYETGDFDVNLTAMDSTGRYANVVDEFQQIPRSDVAPGKVTNLHMLSDSDDAQAVASWNAPSDNSTIIGYSVAFDGHPTNAIDTDGTTFTSQTLDEGNHAVRVKAINDQGNWGETAKLVFTTTAPTTNNGGGGGGGGGGGAGEEEETEENTTVVSGVTLVPTKLPGVVRTLPQLQWTLNGSAAQIASVDCVELQGRIINNQFATIDACNASTSSLKLSILGAKHNDALEAQGRIILKDGTKEEWVSFGTTKIDTKPPQADNDLDLAGDITGTTILVNGTVTITGNAGADDVATVTVDVIKDGKVIEQIPATVGANGDFTAEWTPTETGQYSLIAVVNDPAGNRDTTDQVDVNVVAADVYSAVSGTQVGTDGTTDSIMKNKFRWVALVVGIVILIGAIIIIVKIIRARKARLALQDKEEYAAGKNGGGDGRGLVDGDAEAIGADTLLEDTSLGDERRRGSDNDADTAKSGVQIIEDGTRSENARRIIEQRRGKVIKEFIDQVESEGVKEERRLAKEHRAPVGAAGRSGIQIID